MEADNRPGLANLREKRESCPGEYSEPAMLRSVLTLNPSQLILQATDSNHLQNMATLESAIGDYITDAA
jgi:hypothetical protein